MVNDPEQTPGEDRVTTEGWLLIIAVILAVALSVQIQLDRAAALHGTHGPGQVARVVH